MKKDYHHGDLRNALLAAARSVLADKGIHGLSLRACAAKAGVSHAAPAHHFKSLRGLLTELAIIAFDEFTAALNAGFSSAINEEPAQRLQVVGNAYVQFAIQEPQLFQLMFSSKHIDHEEERLSTTSANAYQELVNVVRPLCELKGVLESAYADAEILVWSVVHGYTNLCIQKMDSPDFALCTNPLPPLTLLGDLLGENKT